MTIIFFPHVNKVIKSVKCSHIINHSSLYNEPTTFQRVVLNILCDLLHACNEIYMDNFTIIGDSFEKALTNLEKGLQRCRDTNL